MQIPFTPHFSFALSTTKFLGLKNGLKGELADEVRFLAAIFSRGHICIVPECPDEMGLVIKSVLMAYLRKGI